MAPGARMQALDVWPEIRERLLAGEPVVALARVIQGERGVLLDVSEGGLVRALVRYREVEVGVLPVGADAATPGARLRFFLESSRQRNALGQHAERVGGELAALRAIMAARLARGEVSVVEYCQLAELDRRWTETRGRIRKIAPTASTISETDAPDRIEPLAVLEERRRLAGALRGAARRLLIELRTIDVSSESEPAPSAPDASGEASA